MRILGKKWLMLAAAVPVAALIACSSDAPVQVLTPSGQVYDEDEYNELVEAGMVDEMGNVIEEDEDEAGSDTDKSSTSKTGTSSSSAKGTSGDANSSAGGDKATSSSAGDKATSSSSGEKATSSSGTGTPASSGTAPASSATPASSSSAPASSATPASSSSEAASSSAVAGQTTIANVDDGDFNMGTDAMKEVSESAQTELDSLKEILDNGGSVDGFEQTDMQFNEETLPYDIFDSQDFFCFTGEGEWLQITRELLGQYIPHYKNGAAWGNLRHFDVKFMDACSAVYIKRK
jgi:hypothetical protein